MTTPLGPEGELVATREGREGERVATREGREGERVATRRLVERLQRDGATATVICDLVIAPALRRLESQRALGSVVTGEVAVAAEICERLVGLLASPSRGRPRGLAIVASLEGECHR